MSTVNFKKVGALIKLEIDDQADIYIGDIQKVKFVMPADGTEIVQIIVDGQFIEIAAITDIKVNGTAVNDEADFETQIALVFPDTNSSSGGTATLQEDILYAALVVKINAGTLTKGVLYKITDRGDRGIFLTAISTTQFAKDSTRLMLCPAFYGLGASGGNNWIGVWNSTKSAVADDLTIWGGLVWKNLTGAIGTADSDILLDAVNWELIPKASYTNSEYVLMEFGVNYDVVNDWIERQWDGSGNIFGIDFYSETTNDQLGFNLCDVSDWNFANDGTGREFYNNRCTGIYNNSNDGSSISENNNYDGIYNNRNIGEIKVNNNMGVIRGNSNSGPISYNANTGEIRSNSNNGSIKYNTNAGTINTNSAGAINGCDINGNTNGGYIDNNSNEGNIRYNSNGGYIGANSNGSHIEYNNNSANINDNSNTGTITLNSNTGNVYFNSNTGNITNNSNGHDIANNSSNVTNIQYNKNNSIISSNSNIGAIEYNRNTAEITFCDSGSNPCNISNNINNGAITGTFSANVTDPIVNKP